MDTPPPASPSPKTEKWSRIGKKVNKVIAIIGIIVFGLIYFGRKQIMGTRYKVSEQESVNYSEKATEADAKKLGEILQATGYFGGTKKMDVLLKKDDKEGTVVSFVISGLGKDDTITTAFKQIGEGIATSGFGKPMTIRLMDTRLNKLKDIRVE
ncbi:MAG: hypothetical protein ABIP20_01660 [Chthoniobacteraceae bacterium]